VRLRHSETDSPAISTDSLSTDVRIHDLKADVTRLRARCDHLQARKRHLLAGRGSLTVRVDLPRRPSEPTLA
jgi:hypothetical protein